MEKRMYKVKCEDCEKDDDQMGEVTEEQAIMFEAECFFWRRYFNLIDYDLTISVEDFNETGSAGVKNADGICGMCDALTGNRCCTIFLNTRIPKRVLNDRTIRKIAFHEIMELFYARIRDLAAQRTFDYEAYDSAIHRLIRVGESTIFEEMEHAKDVMIAEAEFEEQMRLEAEEKEKEKKKKAKAKKKADKDKSK